MYVATLIVLLIEGLLAWRLWTGLWRGVFVLFPKTAPVSRARDSGRYWTLAALLVVLMTGLAWAAWERFAWRYAIDFACARDIDYCP